MRAVLIILLTLVCGVQLRLFQESPFHNEVESHVRHKRDIPATLKDMTYWFDDALKAEFAAMKSAGKSEEEIFAKIDAEFKKLPAEKQQEISTKLKDTCKGIFKPMLSDEEIAKLKTYMTEQKHLDAVALIKTVVAKQPDAVRPGAEKAQKVCSMIYNKGKAKRDVNTSINKHLHWLTEEQKAEIKDMSKNGASNAELKSKLMGYIQETSKNGDKKEATVKSCYKWLESVATADEIKALHAMHHTDHAGCKKKVREFMEKLPAEEKKQVESNLEYCESLWYGSHDHSGHKHEHKHEHKHGHRRRRHLTVIEPITYWMTKEQLKALEESFNLYGEDFSDFNSKFEDFLEALPTELRQNVTEDLKAKCSRWAKEVSKPAEWGHIKKYYAEKDFVPLKDILRELEFRLTENQMHMIEHARPICYKLWDISTIARLVRSPHSRAMEARELREDSYF